ncbi:MAG: MATE family efflux transporter [Sporolactobacillus sp.]
MNQSMSRYTNQTLFQLTWPFFIEIGLHMMMGMMATLMLGRYSDAAAAGVGVANQLLNLFILVFNVTSIGATLLISRHLGADHGDRAVKTAHAAFFMNFWLGLLIAAIVFFFGSHFLALFDVHGQIYRDGLTFLHICGASLFLEAMIQIFSAIIRSHGLAKQAMFVTILMDMISVGANLIATHGLLGWPMVGVLGVSWGMVGARLVALVLLIVIAWRQLHLMIMPSDLFHIERRTIHELLAIGLPSAGEIFSYQIAQLSITALVAILGGSSLSARVYIVNVTMFCFLFTSAIAEATQLLVARSMGSGKENEAYSRGLRTVRIATLSSLAVSIVIASLGSLILSLFTHTEAIIAIGLPVLWINVLAEPGRAINIVLMSSLKSAGDVRFPVLIGVCSMWTIAVGLSYLLGLYWGFGLLGIWIAQGADEWFRGIFALRRWRSRPWLHHQPSEVIFQD